MKTPSPVLLALARHYEKSHAGRTGRGTLDVSIELEALLREVNCRSGEAREIAERQLRELDGKLIQLEFAHKKDKANIFKVRLSPASEAEFYKFIAQPSPTEKRQNLSCLFLNASSDPAVPETWRAAWEKFCRDFSRAALNGEPLLHFNRNDPDETAELLELLPKLLAWPETSGESLVRFASCVVTENKNSKRLEQLAAKEQDGPFQGKLRGRLGRLLDIITEGRIQTLDDLGIFANPRFALVHGPIRLLFEKGRLDLGLLQGPCRIALEDINRADRVETNATRCLTVENETSFHELAKLQSGELLIQTSYPGSATLALLKRLPAAMEFWHFGDTDKDGFEILRVLSEKSGRTFKPLHMQPGRNHFEQESLGRPRISHWPFY